MNTFNTSKTCEQALDEFGRDNSLREKKTYAFMEEYIRKYNGMSWADIFDAIDEEEEKEEQERIKREENEKMQKILAMRRDLLNRGEYELEEGEILDI